MDQTTAAPVVTITGASGETLVSTVIAPTDFLDLASGTVVAPPGTGQAIWVGLTPKDEEAWQVVAFDPRAGAGSAVRIDEGTEAAIAGMRLRFDDVQSLPAALGIGVPGSETPLLAQLTEGPDGEPSLMLVGEGRPAISLAEGEPVALGAYEYTFGGTREFAGISVKRDRGAWFIWIATAMLVGGLAITFYVPRRRLWLKLDGRGTHVAGLAEKSGGFEKDIRILATRMGVEVPPGFRQEDRQ
jgi:cytochrome c biogenesis protein ResB